MSAWTESAAKFVDRKWTAVLLTTRSPPTWIVSLKTRSGMVIALVIERFPPTAIFASGTMESLRTSRSPTTLRKGVRTLTPSSSFMPPPEPNHPLVAIPDVLVGRYTHRVPYTEYWLRTESGVNWAMSRARMRPLRHDNSSPRINWP